MKKNSIIDKNKEVLISVIIPAFNEENTIYETVTTLNNMDSVDEIIVVNDGSKDNTANLALKAGAAVINLPACIGKGGALNIGVKQAKGEIICLLDADLGKTVTEIQKLIEPIQNKIADITIAVFPKTSKKGGFGLVKGLASNGIRFFTGKKLIAPLSGQRVLTREVLKSIGDFERGFGVEVGMSIDALRKGFKILEIPVNMTHNESGRDLKGFLHRGKQFLNVLNVLTRRAVIR